jgi:site-specific recombinase XerD
VVDGTKLGPQLYIPLRDGMTKVRAAAFTEDMIIKAREKINYRLTDTDAFDLAVAICDQAERLDGLVGRERATLFRAPELGGFPDAAAWLERMGRAMSIEDTAKLNGWIERVQRQRRRLMLARALMEGDDPEALRGKPLAEFKPEGSPIVKAVRAVMGKSPLHSDLERDFFAAKARPKNYKRALEQFREQCGDLEIAQYTEDHCWMFRNWLDTAKDERAGELLANGTKNKKLASVSSLFTFSIERRHRNVNPMRGVKAFPLAENVKKKRRLYRKDELEALFVAGVREDDWQYWSPLLGLFAGLRITESIQLRPHDVSDQFGIWHLLIQPGRGQSVKRNRHRAVPVHRELIRLGFIEYAKAAQREKRDWLFADVPLIDKPGREYNAPDVETIMVPSQDAASKWFGRYSDQCGVTDSSVDFHALRGAWITYGSQQGQDLSLRMNMAGHSNGLGVHQTYIYAGPPLKSLKAEIDKIKYPIRIPTR